MHDVLSNVKYVLSWLKLGGECMRPGEAISSSMRHLAEIKGVPKSLLLLFSFLFFYSVSIGPIQKFNPMSFSFLSIFPTGNPMCFFFLLNNLTRMVKQETS